MALTEVSSTDSTAADAATYEYTRGEKAGVIVSIIHSTISSARIHSSLTVYLGGRAGLPNGHIISHDRMCSLQASCSPRINHLLYFP